MDRMDTKPATTFYTQLEWREREYSIRGPHQACHRTPSALPSSPSLSSRRSGNGCKSTTCRSRDKVLRGVAGAALANACAHPVLAGRARELGAHEVVTKSLERRLADGDRVRISWVLETVLERLNIHRARLSDGDVEEGGACGSGSGSNPRFYSFKWGVHQSLSRWIPGPPFLAWWRSIGRHRVAFRSLSRAEQTIRLIMTLAICGGIFLILRMISNTVDESASQNSDDMLVGYID